MSTQIENKLTADETVDVAGVNVNTYVRLISWLEEIL